MQNKRIYVYKKAGFENKNKELLNEFVTTLGITNLKSVKYHVVYDLFDITDEEFEQVKTSVFAQNTSDILVEELDLENKKNLAVMPLVNQFDQRAESAKECLFLINPETKCHVMTGEVLVFEGIDEKDLTKIENYYINPIETCKKDLNKFVKAEIHFDMNEDEINNFSNLNEEQLIRVINQFDIGLSLENMKFAQEYFNKEQRNPRVCELKVLDTYWSDHCRHTTFNTILENINIDDQDIAETFNEYLKMKEEISPTKPITLMDLATIYGKYSNKKGIRTNIEDTIEDNAISLILNEDNKEYLYLFKNETHNHPTEIEPFGGASTCIGGAIRDPLSARAYVYQGMRISAGSNILESPDDTMAHKLPQRVISQKSAHGFSSYGNQIGLATTFVKELYHPGYVAKHLEAGAVIGVAKRENVVREYPKAGDAILLIGGKTGYDGIGGATGSSKSHNEKSLENSAVEVQKGNAPVERKIQRLFANPNASKLIKKCNDFGAGGISVAIGELSDGVRIYLERVPLKVKSLKPSDIALSESQERMAVVIKSDDINKFITYCKEENLEATVVADVTDDNRLVMTYNDELIIDISREFISTNGVDYYQDVDIKKNNDINIYVPDSLKSCFSYPNLIDNKSMELLFDSTVGASTVLMPYGGEYEATKNQVSVHKIPYMKKATSHASYGFNPYIMKEDSYLGAQLAVIDSVTKLIASGVKLKDINLSFQEYFNSLQNDNEKWGEVLSAMLGAFKAQNELKVPSLGGKDSMSGTYNDITVPPTLISFAFGTSHIDNVISSEIKASDENIYILGSEKFSYSNYLESLDKYQNLVAENKITSAFAISDNGLSLSIAKMLMGNKLGCKINTKRDLFVPNYRAIIFTSKDELDIEKLGVVTSDGIVEINNQKEHIEELIKLNNNYFESVYPNLKEDECKAIKISKNNINREYNPPKTDKPNVFIMVFSGTNSEYEMKKAFEDEGCNVTVKIFKNLTKEMINDSISQFVDEIKKADIIGIPGGFSGGDEPDGSGKYIVSVLQNKKIKKALDMHLSQDKLIIGICNGFQALIKSGLITSSSVKSVDSNAPTLFSNDCNHHISKVVKTKVQTKNSPWLKYVDDNIIYKQVISHGEGKIVADETVIERLFANDQVAFTYVDKNPNGSKMAIEGLISPCGKILGKMAHSERYYDGLYQNIPGNKKLDIFYSSVKYFKGE